MGRFLHGDVATSQHAKAAEATRSLFTSLFARSDTKRRAQTQDTGAGTGAEGEIQTDSVEGLWVALSGRECSK